ncbi:MAG: hypothetical protein V1875_09775 [Candidatus Altiarchaeota archaeon]
MDSATALTGLVYMATAYMMAYIFYLLSREAGTTGILGFPTQPYDSNRVILRRRYI